MNQKLPFFLLRITLGWFFFYAGIVKILDPKWSAEGYLKAAKNLPALYNWFASPPVLPITNFVNEWGLALLGVSLILGIFVRLSSVLGVALMLLYYLPILDFPHPNANAYIVDQHVIYIFILIFFAVMRAGRVWGLDSWCARLAICSRFPRLRNWLG